MRRFYTTVTVGEEDGGAVVRLDAKPVRTPGKRVLAFPSSALADAVAHEWGEQGERIDFAAMPLYRLAVAALDWTATERTAALEAVREYVDGDVLCYRDAEPGPLAALEREVWDPWLAWAARRFDATWEITVGILPAAQSERVHAVFVAYAESLDVWRLTALHRLIMLTGSPVLALAMMEDACAADTAFEAAFLGEIYQARRWGEDTEAATRRATVRDEMWAVEAWLRHLK